MRTTRTLVLGALLAACCAGAAVTTAPTPPAGISPSAGKKPSQPPAQVERAPAASPRSSIADNDASSLPKRIAYYFDGHTSDRFYLQTDKPLYRPGESVWFKTWELAAGSLTDKTRAQEMNVELISPKGAVVMKRRVHVAGGSSSGDFDLPEGAQGGEYVLRATAWNGQRFERNIIVSVYEAPRIKKTLEFVRKSYGAGDLVTATVEIKRPTGEILGDKEIEAVARVDGIELPRVHVTTAADGSAIVKFNLPKTLGAGDGLLTILVPDGGVTESISKTIPILQHKLALTFYPEGGSMVSGLAARVYFEAKTPLGKPADVEGRVVDDLGNAVTSFASLKNGLGRTAFTPIAGRSYSAEVTKPAGIKERFALPFADNAGCVMHTYDDFDGQEKSLRVGVLCSETQKVTVVATIREKLLDSGNIVAGPKHPGVIYLASKNPALQAMAGVARVTVFDKHLVPQAERLVFRNRRARLQVQVEPDKRLYAPRGEVGLTITTRLPSGKPVPAELALAAVDDTVISFADDKSGNLLAKLLLEPELQGKLEEPNFYLDLSEEKSAAALDFLVGVRGYRRFEWAQVMRAQVPRPAPPQDIVGNELRKAFPQVQMNPIQQPIALAQRAPLALQAAPNPVVRNVAPGPVAPAPERFVAAAQPAAKAAIAADAIGVLAPEARPMMRVDRDFARAEKKMNAPMEYKPLEWAPVRVFPVPVFQPDYAGARDDFRDTVFWAPSVQTDANGKAHVRFVLSDAVTSFRVTTEGVGAGAAGRDETVFKSSLPFSLSAKLPLEVSAGDHPWIPVTLTNDSDVVQNVSLDADFGTLMRMSDKLVQNETLAPGQSKSLFVPLDVTGVRGLSQVRLAAASSGLHDEVMRAIPVAALGFPQLIEKSGQIRGETTQEVTLTNPLPGSVEAGVRVYVSPLASMVSGLEGMLRQPGGCFEQTSSSNYPNVMIMQYMRQHDVADPALLSRTDKLLENGYKMLTGFESQTKGYEWFGRNPGHEALTAYGLLEFSDMRDVYGSVDPAMLARTAAWLMSRRDGKGGYLRDANALDSFGRAGPDVTNAYITWALATAGQSGLGEELARSARVAETTTDPYLLALTAGTLLQTPRGSASYKSGVTAVARLAKMQVASGAWTDAHESITRSGGINLDIETTSLAVLALLKSDEYLEQARLAVGWLQNNRGGFGQWGATQATVLALKAISAFDLATRVAPTSGTVSLLIDGVAIAEKSYPAGQREPLLFSGLEQQLVQGKHRITLKSSNGSALPYSIAVEYRSAEPASAETAVVALNTALAKTTLKMGETVRLTATITNRTQAGQPMTLARIGIPAGLAFQNWQLKELREKGTIAFFETRAREVIVYLDSLKPGEVKQLPIELVANIPGAYTGPASSAYLYYNDTAKSWSTPLNIDITP
ncbi:MAG TPA: MG2 domain-containing protein [Burkholderiaceae bacterium]